MRVGDDDEVHTGPATGHELSQEREPPRPVLAGHEVQTEDLAVLGWSASALTRRYQGDCLFGAEARVLSQIEGLHPAFRPPARVDLHEAAHPFGGLFS